MPRKRIVLLLWGFGAFLLLGLWGHSILRYSFGIYSHPTKGQRATIGIVGGSLELTWAKVRGGGRRSIHWYTHSLEEKPHFRLNRPRWLGRFYHSHQTGSPPLADLYRTELECPLWFLLLLWTALALPLYLRFARKQNALPPNAPAQPDP